MSKLENSIVRSAHHRRSICYIATSLPIANDFRFAHKQCPGLAKKGFKVCYFGQGDENQDYEGVKIFGIERQNSKLKQTLLPWKLLGRILKQPCDAYHLSTAEWLPMSLLLKLVTKRRIVFDYREDYIEFIRQKPYLKGPLKYLLVGIIRFLVWLVCKSMDGVIFGDEGVQESYPSVPSNRQMFVHHFPLKSLFEPSVIPFADRKYDVVYLGSISEGAGIFMILEAIRILKQMHKDLKVRFIGQAVIYIEDRFNKCIEENGLKDIIEITGKVPYLEVPSLLNQAKVGLIGLRDLPKFHKQSASKLFEYMAKGIPCVSVDLPPERRFMISGEHGYLVPPENPKAMAEAVYKIISDVKLGEKMSKNCREYFLKQEYYAEKEIEKLAEFYNYILTHPRRRLFKNDKPEIYNGLLR